LRALISKVSARVRLGILDTCRGGNWTQTKGLTVGPPPDAADFAPLSSEGVALIASSSGLENAHETDAMGGSFFTHYFASGLLGAADRSGDGSVTLQEAFDYTKERTIRDSARLATTLQHPSFNFELHGQQDVVLSQVAASSSALTVDESRGPLEVIQLSSGITVLEIPPGERKIKLALPPGRYLVRRVQGEDVRAREVDVEKDASVALAEGELQAMGTDKLALKGDFQATAPLSQMSTPVRDWWQVQGAAGISTGEAAPGGISRRGFIVPSSFSYSITERLVWKVPFPALGYRFGDPGRVEFVPAAGLTDFGYSSVYGTYGNVGARAGLRIWTRENESVLLAADVLSFVSRSTSDSQAPSQGLGRWGVGGSAGYTWNLMNAVSFNLALGIRWRDPIADSQPSLSDKPIITIGSFQRLAFQTLPLVRVHITRYFAIDGYAQWDFPLGGQRIDTYLAGLTYDMQFIW
jgi:hypothetical protein